MMGADDFQDVTEIDGRVTSYNYNTFSGRIYLEDLKRTISFVLSSENRGVASVSRITGSFIDEYNRRYAGKGAANIKVSGVYLKSKSGKVGRLVIRKVED